ncbi:MAG: ribosome-associated translation inhibitor RaiA [Acidimicrobiia bacterium]|nr:ribosome-associated translation inhibitor RaiA [Acidimicrobiia bacterium]MDH4308443.1 ribosome-associated translation inhibitor RaiA [Acidimicrobiia bacterium]
MDVRLHTRNTTIDDRFRTVVEDKVGHAGRVFDHDTTVDVELTEERNPRRERFRIELSTSIAGRFLRVASDAPTPEAALDDAIDRFTRQLRRTKERTIDRGRRGAASHADDSVTSDEPEVVRTKQFVMKPMLIEEAALQMDMVGHDFFFFLNATTHKQSVLYRRRDGRLGLIEPA